MPGALSLRTSLVIKINIRTNYSYFHVCMWYTEGLKKEMVDPYYLINIE